MRKGILLLTAGIGLAVLGAGVAFARPACFQGAEEAPSAELKIGLGIEKMEVTGESSDLKVAPGTKVYAWAKISGCADSKITIAFSKGDKVAFRQELDVPRSPYRTHAYRTFRAGDEGEWKAEVLTAEGTAIGSAAFKVALEK